MKKLQEKGEKAMITYITAGLPDYDTTCSILEAEDRAGIDVVELGIPFSDPVADGPVIQAASQEAIRHGANLDKTFDMVKKLRQNCELPIVFMMYYNTIVHHGVQKFIDDCREAGVDGLIVPDCPYEEQFELNAAMKGQDDIILIQLVSPVSGDRIPMITKNARGFVYCVSSMGVTGQNADFHKNVNQYLQSVKDVSPVPVMMGFGIRTAADVEHQKHIIDGAIIGTAFIKLMEEHNYDPAAAEEYVRTFKKELNA